MPTNSKIDFAQLFKDTKQFPDDMKITLSNGNEVTLGDLRVYDTSRGGELQTELTRQQDILKADQGKLQQASERVAQLYIELEAEKKKLQGQPQPNAQPAADPLAAYDTDPVFAPVTGKLRAIERAMQDKLDKLTGEIDKLVKGMGQMGITYMGDKAARDFSEIMAADDPVRPKDLSLDALYKLAVERRILDRNNLPDIKAAYNDLTRDARHAHDLVEARKDERKKIETELQEGAMLPRPNGSQPAVTAGLKPEEMPKNLNDAFNKAGADKPLWKQITEASSPILGGQLQ